MGIVQALLTRRKPAGGGDYTGVVRIGGSSYSSRWHFTRILDSVYANPTARRCVEYIANDFQRPDWQLRNVNTDVDIDPKDERYSLFNKPGGITSGTAMQYHISRDLDLSGGTTWLKLRGNDGDVFGDRGPVTSLRRLAPQRVTIIADDDDELLGFIYQDRMGRIAPLLPQDVVYVNYPHPDRPADRMAPALVAGLPAETDTAAMKFNFELLSNDSALPGYLVVEGLTTAQFSEWAAQWQSSESPGKTRFIKGSNAKYVKVGQTNQELTYTELRKASQEDICRAFGPARVLIDPTDSTFSNMGVARTNYMVSLIDPRWTLVGDAFSMQLSDDIGADIGFKLDEIEELQESMQAYVDRTMPLVDRDIVMINEVRRELKLDDVGWGNVPLSVFRASNALPVDSTAPDQLIRERIALDVKSVDAALLELEAAPVVKSVNPKADNAKKIDKQRKRAEASMKRFFDRQGKAVAARIKSKKSVAKASDDAFDGDRWNTELGELWDPLLSDTVDMSGAATLESLGLDTEFDAHNNRVENYLIARTQKIAELVNGTTEDEVRDVIASLTAEGKGVNEIADAITEYFTESAEMRATRVARTEVLGAFNWASIEGAKQSGVVSHKEWLTSGDCDHEECLSLGDLGPVGLDDDFDGNGDPPLHPNCECSVTFTINEDAA